MEEELQAEVGRLVGARYSRTNPEKKRGGSNPGSIYLGDQNVPLRVPRVRDVAADREVPLAAYQSRAWMLEGIAAGLPVGDPRLPALRAAARGSRRSPDNFMKAGTGWAASPFTWSPGAVWGGAFESGDN